MELNLRQAIEQRMQGKSEDELADIVESTIGGEEMALPGLGVLYEKIWQGSTAAARKKMMNVLHKDLN